MTSASEEGYDTGGLNGMVVPAEMKYQDLVHFLDGVDVDQSRLIFEDELTGLYNRRFLLRYLEQSICWDSLGSEPISLLMIDVDHFKNINDKHGHGMGDRVLIWVARMLKDLAGEKGLPIRYAGDELMILLPGTGKEEALKLGEQLVSEVHDRPSPLEHLDNKLAVTLSIGIAGAPDDAQRGKDLIQQADGALYCAKRSGRDQFADAAQAAHADMFAKTGLFQLERGSIVGREGQLKEVRKALQEFTRGKSQFLSVEGGDGMGKSGFLKALNRSLEGSSIRPVEARGVFQEGFSPYYMTTSVLARIMNRLPDRGAAVLDELSPRELNSLAAILPQLGQSKPPDHEDDEATRRATLFATLVRLIPKLLDSNPLLLLIDDLDLSDEATLLVLREIMVGQDLPIFICGTSKPVEMVAVERLQAPLYQFWMKHGDELNISRIGLTPLTAEDIERHFESVFPKIQLPPYLKNHLAQLTQGNPLFINEIQHKLVHDRKIVLRNHSWEIEPLKDDYLPQSLEEIVEQQIARLDEESRQLLEQVSTFGEKVALSMLTGSSKLTESRVLEFVDQAVAHGLISSEYETNDETIRFLSKRVMNLTYGAIEEDRKEELHERIGTYQESLYAQNLHLSTATLAHHFQLSANREKAAYYRNLSEAHNARVFDSSEAVGYSAEKTQGPSARQRLRILDSLKRRAVDHVPAILEALTTGVREITAGSSKLGAAPSPVGALKEELDRVLADNRYFIITCASKMLAVNGEPVDTTGYAGAASDFMNLLEYLGLRGVAFTPGISEKELEAMLQAMGRAGAKGIDWAHWRRFAAEQGPLHVEFKQERRPRIGTGSPAGVQAAEIGLANVQEEQPEVGEVAKMPSGDRESPARDTAVLDVEEPRINIQAVELTESFLESSAEQLSDLLLRGDLDQAKRIVAQLFRNFGRENSGVHAKIVKVCGGLLADVAIVSQPAAAKVLTDPLLHVWRNQRECTVLTEIEQLLSRTARNLAQFGDYRGAGRILIRLRRTQGGSGEADRFQAMDPMMQSVLLHDLKSPDSSKLQEATLLLAGLGPAAVSFLVEIVKHDDDPRLRQIAGQLLSEAGEAGAQALKKEITFSGAAEERVRILSMIDLITDDVRKELACALEDRDPAVRKAAFSLAERLRNPPVMLLVNYARHPDLTLAMPALQCLEKIKPPGLVKELDSLLHSAKEDERRVACCQILGRIGDPAGVDALERILSAGRVVRFRRKSSALRVAAAFALAAIADPRASEILVRYKEDPEPAIAQVAQEIASSRIGPKPRSARDRRQYKRYSVCVPCSVEWSGHKITGTVINISVGGALVAEVDAIPPRGSTVSLALHSDASSVQLECTLSSRIVHGDLRPKQHGGALFGVRFEEAPEEVTEKLRPVFRFFAGEE